jgi:hypothetical protein
MADEYIYAFDTHKSARQCLGQVTDKRQIMRKNPGRGLLAGQIAVIRGNGKRCLLYVADDKNEQSYFSNDVGSNDTEEEIRRAGKRFVYALMQNCGGSEKSTHDVLKVCGKTVWNYYMTGKFPSSSRTDKEKKVVPKKQKAEPKVQSKKREREGVVAPEHLAQALEDIAMRQLAELSSERSRASTPPPTPMPEELNEEEAEQKKLKKCETFFEIAREAVEAQKESVKSARAAAEARKRAQSAVTALMNSIKN